MKKLIVVTLVCWSVSAAGVCRADKSLDQLAANPAPAGGDLYYCLQGSADYKCTLDQVRQWSSVGITGGTINGAAVGGATPATGRFTTLVTTGSAGIGATAVNTLDVEGGAVIGATYSGASMAPANGLLVQGDVAIGAASAIANTSLTLSKSFAGGTPFGTLNLYSNDTNVTAGSGSYQNQGIVSFVLGSVPSGTTNTGSYNGINQAVYHRGDGALAIMRGIVANYGTQTTTSGTLSNAYGLQLTLSKSAGSSIVNAYGVYIAGQDNATNAWDVYASSPNAYSYFAGSVGLGVTVPTARLDVNSNTIRIRTAKTPSSSSEACNAGTMAWDTGFLYVCTATNTWKRATLNAF